MGHSVGIHQRIYTQPPYSLDATLTPYGLGFQIAQSLPMTVRPSFEELPAELQKRLPLQMKQQDEASHGMTGLTPTSIFTPCLGHGRHEYRTGP